MKTYTISVYPVGGTVSDFDTKNLDFFLMYCDKMLDNALLSLANTNLTRVTIENVTQFKARQGKQLDLIVHWNHVKSRIEQMCKYEPEETQKDLTFQNEVLEVYLTFYKK